jgi:hypothetical protein
MRGVEDMIALARAIKPAGCPARRPGRWPGREDRSGGLSADAIEHPRREGQRRSALDQTPRAMFALLRLMGEAQP